MPNLRGMVFLQEKEEIPGHLSTEKGQVRIQQEDGHLQNKERDLRGIQFYWHLDLELSAS